MDVLELLTLYASASDEIKNQIAAILEEDGSQSEHQDSPS